MEDQITFVLEEDEEDKARNDERAKHIPRLKTAEGKIPYYVRPAAKRILIIRNGEKVGHIFTPASSSDSVTNAIQICGFSEAYDLWGCGIFGGYKDIQLLFDTGKCGGSGIEDGFNNRHISLKANTKTGEGQCVRCFREPCMCEDKVGKNPFIVKREHELKDRIKYKSNRPLETEVELKKAEKEKSG